jgi:hypothetical protein
VGYASEGSGAEEFVSFSFLFPVLLTPPYPILFLVGEGMLLGLLLDEREMKLTRIITQRQLVPAQLSLCLGRCEAGEGLRVSEGVAAWIVFVR